MVFYYFLVIFNRLICKESKANISSYLTSLFVFLIFASILIFSFLLQLKHFNLQFIDHCFQFISPQYFSAIHF